MVYDSKFANCNNPVLNRSRTIARLPARAVAAAQIVGLFDSPIRGAAPNVACLTEPRTLTGVHVVMRLVRVQIMTFLKTIKTGLCQANKTLRCPPYPHCAHYHGVTNIDWHCNLRGRRRVQETQAGQSSTSAPGDSRCL